MLETKNPNKIETQTICIWSNPTTQSIEMFLLFRTRNPLAIVVVSVGHRNVNHRQLRFLWARSIKLRNNKLIISESIESNSLWVALNLFAYGRTSSRAQSVSTNCCECRTKFTAYSAVRYISTTVATHWAHTSSEWRVSTRRRRV